RVTLPQGVGMTGIFEKLKTTDERWERYLFATYCRPGPGLDGPSTVQAPPKGHARATQGRCMGRFTKPPLFATEMEK
ncbi:MAG TPA: hypothetical protein VGN44_16345, partial [Candidatus Angelobacter sp.]